MRCRTMSAASEVVYASSAQAQVPRRPVVADRARRRGDGLLRGRWPRRRGTQRALKIDGIARRPVRTDASRSDLRRSRHPRLNGRLFSRAEPAVIPTGLRVLARGVRGARSSASTSPTRRSLRSRLNERAVSFAKGSTVGIETVARCTTGASPTAICAGCCCPLQPSTGTSFTSAIVSVVARQRSSVSPELAR